MKKINFGEFDVLEKYSGSLVKTKTQDFYNELIWLISSKEMGKQWNIPQIHICIKLHMAIALPDSSMKLVFDNQVQNDVVQSYTCGYIVQ